MKRLETALKILLGKQLSHEDIEKAQKGVKEKFSTCNEKKYSMHGEDIEIMTTYFEYKRTPDVSYGWRNPHEGWYPCKKNTKVYTLDGKLKETNTIAETPMVCTNRSSWNVKYKTPGSIFGKPKFSFDFI